MAVVATKAETVATKVAAAAAEVTRHRSVATVLAEHDLRVVAVFHGVVVAAAAVVAAAEVVVAEVVAAASQMLTLRSSWRNIKASESRTNKFLSFSCWRK